MTGEPTKATTIDGKQLTEDPLRSRGVASEASAKNERFQQLIRELESSFPVDRWVLDGVHIWPIIRMHLYHSYFDYHYFEQQPVRAGTFRFADVVRQAASVVRSMLRHVWATLSDIRKTESTGKKTDILFLNFNIYMTLINGSWYSRLCDPFIQYFSQRGLSSIMLTAGYRYSTPRFTSSAFIQPSLVLYRLMGMVGCGPRLRGFAQLAELQECVRRSGILHKSFDLVEPVERHLRQISSIARYFSGLLETTQPKAVFVTCCYGTESMACILACHRKGVPTIDIQHGNQGDFHIAYGNWNRVPPSGYELLPTAFWCWSEHERAAIEKWSHSVERHQPVVGGNLFLERWVAGEDATVQAYDDVLRELKRPFRDHVHVLYTLNGCTRDELQEMVDVIQAADRGGLICRFWIRVHPVNLGQAPTVRRLLKESKLDNCDLENATALPLYALLRHMDVHMTEFSSVVIEAESFGVPSIIRELGEVSYSSQIRDGWVLPARSVHEAARAIQVQFSQREHLARQRGRVTVSSDSGFDRLFALVPSLRGDTPHPATPITGRTIAAPTRQDLVP